MDGRRNTSLRLLGALGLIALVAGCVPSYYDPERATQKFPEELHLHTVQLDDERTVEVPVAVDMQVFRKDQRIEIVQGSHPSR